jgi:hypothetical protein
MDYNTNYNPKFLTSNYLFLRTMKLYYFLQWKVPLSKNKVDALAFARDTLLVS